MRSLSYVNGQDGQINKPDYKSQCQSAHVVHSVEV